MILSMTLTSFLHHSITMVTKSTNHEAVVFGTRDKLSCAILFADSRSLMEIAAHVSDCMHTTTNFSGQKPSWPGPYG